jgi:hypothetical protein
MVILRVALLLAGAFGIELVFSTGAWAWGAAVHTVIACNILDQATSILPAIADIIRAYPLQYVYGNLAADFFVGKGQKKKKGHSHNWDTGFRCLEEAGDEQEASYAYGFLSHLAADVIAHNYFVPNLICNAFTWKRMGHIYWEAKADYEMGHLYTRIAREVLTMSDLGCDDMLISAVGNRRNGLKTRRKIYTQTVKFSEFLYMAPSSPFPERRSRTRIFGQYLGFTAGLAYRLVLDFLKNPGTSPCLSYDPIGSENLFIAGRHHCRDRWQQLGRPKSPLFPVDEELLDI